MERVQTLISAAKLSALCASTHFPLWPKLALSPVFGPPVASRPCAYATRVWTAPPLHQQTILLALHRFVNRAALLFTGKAATIGTAAKRKQLHRLLHGSRARRRPCLSTSPSLSWLFLAFPQRTCRAPAWVAAVNEEFLPLAQPQWVLHSPSSLASGSRLCEDWFQQEC